MYTNAHITIFNLVPQSGTGKATYEKTQINDVFWEKVIATADSENGLKKEDNIQIYIPIDSLSKLDKVYKTPKSFLKAENKNTCYTFQSKDIVIKGIIEEENVSLKELKEKYDDVYTIQSVSDNRYGSEELQHFFLIAK